MNQIDQICLNLSSNEVFNSDRDVYLYVSWDVSVNSSTDCYLVHKTVLS